MRGRVSDDSWRARIQGGAPLPDDQEAAFRAECDAVNRSRLRPVLALLGVGHLLHVAAFHLTDAERAALPARLVLWREHIGLAHAVTAIAAALLAIAARLLPDRAMGALAWAAGATYLLHAAWVAGVDQLNTPTVTPYMAYSVVIAMLVVMPPLRAAAMFALGMVAVEGALLTMQPDPEIRRTFLPNAPSVTVASIAMVAFLYGARRRDFLQRGTIAAQQAQLESWNQQLEARVDRQVREIRANAEEMERLNARLQVQVRDRSRELARALERLDARDPGPAELDGRVLGGRFELFRRIGAGGMGAVYEGFDRTTHQRVAVKVIRSGAAPVTVLRRFLREAESAASVSHPAIVRMLHVDVDEDGTFFQVQELVDGETLAQVLRRHGRFRPSATARVLAVLGEALAAAHARGLVHRDVKPANIMLVRQSPGLKLLDFGIAKLREVLEDAALGADAVTAMDGAPLTRAGARIGTPGFMAPEQQAGDASTDRSDVHAAGLVGRWLLGGELGPDPELAAVLTACLADDPGERPSAVALAAGLHALADARGEPALPELVARDTLRGHTASDANDATLPGE